VAMLSGGYTDRDDQIVAVLLMLSIPVIGSLFINKYNLKVREEMQYRNECSQICDRLRNINNCNDLCMTIKYSDVGKRTCDELQYQTVLNLNDCNRLNSAVHQYKNQ